MRCAQLVILAAGTGKIVQELLLVSEICRIEGIFQFWCFDF